MCDKGHFHELYSLDHLTPNCDTMGLFSVDKHLFPCLALLTEKVKIQLVQSRLVSAWIFSTFKYCGPCTVVFGWSCAELLDSWNRCIGANSQTGKIKFSMIHKNLIYLLNINLSIQLGVRSGFATHLLHKQEKFYLVCPQIIYECTIKSTEYSIYITRTLSLVVLTFVCLGYLKGVDHVPPLSLYTHTHTHYM